VTAPAAPGAAAPAGAARVVVICVPTHRRPKMLGALLEGLGRLAFRGPHPRARLVVVDNDPLGSARAVCDAAGPRLGWPLRYVLEPRRGIAVARNTAIREAGPDADLIAFVDDDEVPDPRWLDELLRVQASHHADVVAGPAVPQFLPGAPPWLTRGGPFHRRRYRTGSRPRAVSTNNVLIRREVFARLGGFDERLALIGNEDRHFFLRARRAGVRIVWADEALVHEWIPPSRARVRWLLRRKYRSGANTSLMHELLGASAWRQTLLAAEGCQAIVAGALLIPWAFAAGRPAIVWCLQEICRGAGMLAGVAGRRYERYRITDGE